MCLLLSKPFVTACLKTLTVHEGYAKAMDALLRISCKDYQNSWIESNCVSEAICTFPIACCKHLSFNKSFSSVAPANSLVYKAISTLIIPQWDLEQIFNLSIITQDTFARILWSTNRPFRDISWESIFDYSCNFSFCKSFKDC